MICTSFAELEHCLWAMASLFTGRAFAGRSMVKTSWLAVLATPGMSKRALSCVRFLRRDAGAQHVWLPVHTESQHHKYFAARTAVLCSLLSRYFLR